MPKVESPQASHETADEVQSKLPPSSLGHVDMEVRQRRLQRFYSLPTTSGVLLPRKLETVSEGGGGGSGEGEPDQSREASKSEDVDSKE